MVAKGERAGGEMEEEVGVGKCKLLYIDQTNNKVLLWTGMSMNGAWAAILNIL